MGPGDRDRKRARLPAFANPSYAVGYGGQGLPPTLKLRKNIASEDKPAGRQPPPFTGEFYSTKNLIIRDFKLQSARSPHADSPRSPSGKRIHPGTAGLSSHRNRWSTWGMSPSTAGINFRGPQGCVAHNSRRVR